jgi:hypothetical protein
MTHFEGDFLLMNCTSTQRHKTFPDTTIPLKCKYSNSSKLQPPYSSYTYYFKQHAYSLTQTTSIPILHTIKIPRHISTKEKLQSHKAQEFPRNPLSGITTSTRTRKKQQFQQKPETETSNYDKSSK